MAGKRTKVQTEQKKTNKNEIEREQKIKLVKKIKNKPNIGDAKNQERKNNERKTSKQKKRTKNNAKKPINKELQANMRKFELSLMHMAAKYFLHFLFVSSFTAKNS